MDDDNCIVKLIEHKMKADNWTAWTPDSYFSYLLRLNNDEIKEAIKLEGKNEL